jgi:outer membrane immunogenic protein
MLFGGAMRQMLSVLLGATALSFASAPSAVAADMPVKAVVAVPYLNWTGFYVGLNAGYGWGNPNSHLGEGPTPSGFGGAAPLLPADYNPGSRGFIGGAQAGYNYQINTVVVGVETDIQFGSINGTMTTGSTALPLAFATFTESQKLSLFGTLRGRIGFLPMSNLLLYGTGGLAYGRVNVTSQFRFDTPPFNDYSGSTTQTKTGWTIGGGAEWALNPSWSVKAEYLYYDLGTVSVTGLKPTRPLFSTSLSQNVTGSIARLGVNYKFSQ